MLPQKRTPDFQAKPTDNLVHRRTVHHRLIRFLGWQWNQLKNARVGKYTDKDGSGYIVKNGRKHLEFAFNGNDMLYPQLNDVYETEREARAALREVKADLRYQIGKKQDKELRSIIGESEWHKIRALYLKDHSRPGV